MVRSKFLPLVLLAALCLVCSLPPAHAAFSTWGNVDPSDPSKWTDFTTGYVGETSGGTLTVDSGNLLSLWGYIGSGGSATGLVNISGTNSKWTSTGVIVGGSGSGTLNITNGGNVSGRSIIGNNSGSTGTATVSGLGSTWTNSDYLYVGYSGAGTLNITNGGNVSNVSNNEISYGYIGYNSGSTGTVAVDGSNSTWSNADGLDVGYSGAGTLNITNGGTVSNAYGWGYTYIGHNSGSTGAVTVSGTGATWTHSGTFAVGYSGNGALNITNGGAVSVGDSGYDEYIGYNAGSTGVVMVSGTGSTWTNNDDLYVGSFGAGTLDITSGGSVSVAGATYVGPNTSSTCTINFGPNGGTLTTKSLYASPTQMTGTGTINTNGLVSDVNLVFDSTHALSQTVPGFGNVAVNLNMSNSSNVGNLGAGYQGSGSLTIQNGIAVTSTNGYLGFKSGSTGTATVSGLNSTWTNSGYLYVGSSGAGTLTITNGGNVSSNYGSIGDSSSSTGVVTVSGSGSTWTNSNDLYVGSSGNGTLNITGGGTADFEGYTYIGYNSGSTGAVTVSGTGSTWTSDYFLQVGSYGTGTLNVTNGAVSNSMMSLIGSWSGSMGTATVSGAGSAWNSYLLYIGNNGDGTLNITGGGRVNGRGSFIGYQSGSTGKVTVSGTGSTWTLWSNSSSLCVGSSGTGTLSINGGGTVTTGGSVSINSTSLLAVDVGRGSSLAVGGGTGTIANNGTLRILAGAGVPAGNTYSPISAGTWSGSGTYQAVGGTWNAGSHQFTASDVQTGASGAPVTIDLAQKQRILVSDGPTGWALGGSFLATSSSTLTLTAATISGGTLTSLNPSLDAGETVLSGWTLSAASGYASGNPAYLSFGVGAAQFLDDLQVWQYSGGSWAKYATTDLTYDRTYASLTVTDLGVYAVTGDLVLMGDANRDGTTNGADLNVVLSNYNQTGATWAMGDFDGNGTVNGADLNTVLSNYNQHLSVGVAVPEPATLVLLATGLLGLISYAWRKRI